jgi:hypothetical protein
MWQFSIDEATFEALLVSQYEPLQNLLRRRKKESGRRIGEKNRGEESVFAPGALLCTG